MLTILADDLTGACDTGSLFTAAGTVPVTVWPQAPPDGRVCVADTESRALGGDAAYERVAAAAGAAPPSRFFKKIDSTLRGNIGREVDALIRVIRAPGAVLTPAFPSQGRVVLDRMLLVDGIPVAETPLGRDPEFPGRGTSNVVDLLRAGLDRALAWIPIDQVRAGAHELAARLHRLAGTVAVADAETDEDLDALVEAALIARPAPLLVGAAGLARALAARLALLGERPELPSGSRWLVVAGSRHPATRAQIAAARAAGMRVIATADAESTGRAKVAARLAAEARRLLAREPFDVVVVTGGETAVALYQALDAERIDLVGVPAPGLALGWLRAPRHPALGIVTKAGGFGAPDLLVSLWKEAVA
jgi:uncharacterized protein YgbK (DUF1537 family)